MHRFKAQVFILHQRSRLNCALYLKVLSFNLVLVLKYCLAWWGQVMSLSDECRDTGNRFSLRQTCRFLYQVDLLAEIGNGIWVLIESGSEPTDTFTIIVWQKLSVSSAPPCIRISGKYRNCSHGCTQYLQVFVRITGCNSEDHVRSPFRCSYVFLCCVGYAAKTAACSTGALATFFTSAFLTK